MDAFLVPNIPAAVVTAAVLWFSVSLKFLF
jgi:hypothetical protein